MLNAGTLPPLREIIATHDLGARKELGQNYLLDLNLTRKIVRAAGDVTGFTVMEIGPGPGGLTRALLESPAAQVIVIEKDARFLTALHDLEQWSGGKLSIIQDDALKIDYKEIVPQGAAIIANLPYNIATPLLLGWLKNIDYYTSLTLMFQKEVAQRLVAQPRSKEYGRLSILTQWLAVPRIAFDVLAQAFTPPPKVTSSIVHLTPRPRTDAVPIATMEQITALAFGQRRKMLRSSLKPLVPDIESFLLSVNIQPTARAEELSVDDFVRIADAFQKL